MPRQNSCRRAEILRLAHLHSYKDCGCDKCLAEDTKRFWTFVRKTAAEVATWPEWKKS